EFWTEKRPKLPSLIGTNNFEILNNVLFGDVCKEMVQKTELDLYEKTCRGHLPTAKGFVSFLLHEDHEIEVTRAETLKLTDFLKASKLAAQALHNTMYSFLPET